MKVLITGSRGINDTAKVARAVTRAINELRETNPEAFVSGFIHGGAEGVDTCADELAALIGLPKPHVERPDYDQYGKRAPIVRNNKMVDMLGPGDIVVAVWDGRSRGTHHTIQYAKETYKKVYVFLEEQLKS